MIRQPRQRPIKDDHLERELFRQRAQIGFVVIALLCTLLAARYVYLQIWQHDNFTTRSESNRVQVRPLAPNRGLIYDRRGRVIADNQPAYRLELIPEKAGDVDAVLAELATLLEMSEDDLERFAVTRTRYRSFESIPVLFDLSERNVARFSVNRHRFAGVSVVPYLSRNYPYADLLTHVLGYVGRMDARDQRRLDPANYRATTHVGKLGVERSYEAQLHGTSGIERVETNARGRVLQVLERQDPVPGTDVVLSIDVAVQQAAWDALGERAGAVVAIDPRDGSVIALVSKPSFDPNLFVHGIRSLDYQALLDRPYRPLFNRALAGGYEPGSTLKPFVGLAGLELGVMDPGERVFSNGEYYLPNYNRPYRDWKSGGHGFVDIKGALEESVNTYFYQVAYELGIDRMHEYLSAFGFGQRTGIDLPGENTGLLPSRAWKERRYEEPWYPGETVIAGIGQGFNVVTPLQLANAQAALINNGQVFAPRVVYALKAPGGGTAVRQQAPQQRVVPRLNQENWDLVLEGMRRVVNGSRGTAREIATGAEYTIAGKTGTAQVSALDRNRTYAADEIDESLRDHALFVAFAPFDEPRISIAVVVDNGGAGSTVAAPIARATLDAWLQQELMMSQRP